MQIILGRCGGITGHLLVARQHRIGSEDRIGLSKKGFTWKPNLVVLEMSFQITDFQHRPFLFSSLSNFEIASVLTKFLSVKIPILPKDII